MNSNPKLASVIFILDPILSTKSDGLRTFNLQSTNATIQIIKRIIYILNINKI